MSGGERGPARHPPQRDWLWLLPPVLVGAFVRLFRLGPQLLLYDELHLLRAIDALDLGEILTTYLPSDSSIPLTALYEALVERGVALSELHLRLPSLAAGLLALVVVPAMLRPRLGPRAAIAAAWLVAISPALVAYSRIARTYMPVALLVFVAAMAFERWWRTGSRGAATGYVLAGAAAVWLHLGAAPIVTAPFVWAAGAKAVAWTSAARGAPGRRMVEIVLLGVALAAAFAAFLVPAWESFVALLADKSGGIPPGGTTIGQALLLQAGVARGPLLGAGAALFALLAAGGLGVLLRQRPALATLTLTMVVVNLAVLLVTAPFGTTNPLVLGRYLLVGLPLVLCWPAAGLAALWRAAGGWSRPAARPGARRAARAAVAAIVPLLVLAGPFDDRRLLYSDFLTDNDLVAFAVPLPRMASPELVPRFYRRLAAEGPGGAVIEAPGLPTWMLLSHLRIYQDVHRRRVLLAPAERTFASLDLDLANYVEPSAGDFLAAPARWLVLHRKSPWELDRVAHADGVGLPTDRPMREMAWRQSRRLRRQLRWEWGPPDHTDDVLVVYDLDRVRRERGRVSGG